MTREIEIEQAILRMEPELFARMAAAVLERDGYPRFHINTVSGKVRSRKNTPDAHCEWPGGTMSFLQCTVQEKRLLQKLTKDLSDCINKRPPNVPRKKIREVILCTSERIHLDQRAALGQQAKALKVKLTPYDLGRVTEVLVTKGEDIAQAYLGIALGSGQIHSRASFVKPAARSPHATDYTTSFRFREEQVTEALAQLSTAPVVILAGNGGVGKTRLALEVVDRLIQSEPGLHTWYIRSRDLSLAEELQKRCAAPGHYVLLVDDAHQFGDLKSVIALLDNTRPDRSFRMVFTARRIALAAVKEATEGYRTGGPIELKPWSDEEIRTFLHEEYNIGKNLYVDRILYMAKGNPRIAAMVASIIHKAKGYRGFQDVAHAFQLYYSKDKAARTAWEDPGTLRVLWAFSFFRHIEGTKYQARVLPDLLPLLDMDMATFWAKARALDRLELLDLHGPEGPGLIADDTFGTYLVHRVLFQEKEVALDSLLITCFPKHREPIVIAINSVLNVFHTSGEEEYLAQAVSRAIAHFTEVNDTDTVGELHEAFWAIDPTRTLAYAQQLVEAVPEEPSTDDYAFDDHGKAHSHFDAALRLLGRFGECPDAGLRGAAAELMLRYLHRCPSKAAEVAGAMVAAFDMDEKAEGYQYLPQRELARLLIGLSKKGDAAATGLFFATAKNFLSVQTWRILSTRKRNTVSSRVHRPEVNAHLKKLRKMVWGHVSTLWRNPAYQAQVIKVLRDHMGGMYHEVSKKLLAFDAEHIASFCMEHLDPENFDHCILVHELLTFWRRRSVRPKQDLGAHFMNDVFRLKLELSYDRLTRNIDTDELEDHDAWLKRLHALGEGTAPAALRRMMKPALLIMKSEKGGMFPLGVSRAMESVLLGATEGNPPALAQELRLAFNFGNPLGLGPGYLLSRAFDELGAEALEALLSSGPFEGRTRWWLAYFDELAKHGMKLADPGAFERTVMEAVSMGYYVSLPVLFHFKEQCPGLIVAITRSVIENGQKWRHTEFWLADLFHGRNIKVNDLFAPFVDDMELLQRAFYLTVCRGISHKQAPVVFKTLLEADASFAKRWVNWRYQKEYYLPKPEDFKLDFIWQRADAPLLMDAIYAVACNTPKLFCGNDDYLTSFFLPNAGEELTAEVAAAQDAWLRMHIEQDHAQLEHCQVLMGIVHALPQDRRLALLEHFINQKPEERIFRETVLDLRFSRVTMKGPGVGLGKLEFYETLRSCCKGLAGLRYRRLIEEAAKSTKEEVKEEQVEQMIEDRW